MIKIFALASFSLLYASVEDVPLSSPQVERPFVTCDMRGGLGNQLFEIATTLAHAWDHDAIAIFPDLHREDTKISYHRDRVFFRMDTSTHPRPVLYHYHEWSWHSSEEIPFRPDQKLFGYFQSWKRFDYYRDRLIEAFTPKQEVLDYLSEKYSDLISHPQTVSIHVRTANARSHAEKIHYFVGLEYYKKAMDLFPSDTLFVVFSDRINWCKMHFPMLGRPCVFIEGNDEVEDLFLMSMMKHQIIPNSTFSWWGTYLNQNPDKITIVPQCWQHPDLFAFPMTQPNEFYLPDWILVTPNYNEPYPSDMTCYDPPPWDGD